MRLAVLYRSILVALIAVLSLTACRDKSKDVTPEGIESQGALTEQHDAGALVFSVAPNGQVQLLVKGTDGKPLEKGVSGTLTVKGEGPKAEPVKVALLPDPKTGLLSAAIPELVDDLTEVKYELTVNDKPIKGTLHLPAGGTKELEENAKVTAEAKIPPGTKGPNGGIVQVVGDDIIEVVAGKTSGAVRVYLLDADLKPIPIGSRKIKLAFQNAKGSETVVLAPGPDSQYFVGKMTLIANPVKITVVLTYHDHTHVVLCGHHPGSVIVVGPSAPVIIILVNVSWDIDVVVVPPPPVIIVHGKGKGKGHWKHKHKHKH
jgi:hypothetical protein